ncbi:MAG: four helix bundle protein [Cyclobacteriaceae bacterium]
MTNNVILNKSFEFAKKIIYLYSALKNEKEFDLGRQLLRSGTSIGANIEEAQGAISKKDFIAKIHISYKEARETHYWLRLLKDCSIVEKISLINF